MCYYPGLSPGFCSVWHISLTTPLAVSMSHLGTVRDTHSALQDPTFSEHFVSVENISKLTHVHSLLLPLPSPSLSLLSFHLAVSWCLPFLFTSSHWETCFRGITFLSMHVVRSVIYSHFLSRHGGHILTEIIPLFLGPNDFQSVQQCFQVEQQNLIS